MAKNEVKKVSKRTAANMLRELREDLDWGSFGSKTRNNADTVRELLTKLARNLEHGAPL